MRELRTAGAFTNRPNIDSGCLEPLVHLHVTSLIQFDTSDFQPNSGGVRCPASGNQDIAACNFLFAGGRSHGYADTSSGATVHTDDLGRGDDVNSVANKYLKDFGYNVRVLVSKKLRAQFKNRYPTSKTTIGLSEFKPDMTTSDNNQVFG